MFTNCIHSLSPLSDTNQNRDPISYVRVLFTRQMIVFGDSTSDAGRRFNSPASFDFDDIGPYPWTYLFEEPGSDVSAQEKMKNVCFIAFVYTTH